MGNTKKTEKSLCKHFGLICNDLNSSSAMVLYTCYYWSGIKCNSVLYTSISLYLTSGLEKVWSRLMMVFLSSDVSIDEKKVSEILGDLIWEEMSECIIRECLVHSIPANSSQLAEYSEVRLQGSVSLWQLCCILCNIIFNCILRSLNRQKILRAVWKEWGTMQGTQRTS